MNKKKAELKGLISRMLLVGCGQDHSITWHIKAREQMFYRLAKEIDAL
jgi:hypothetical protein